MMVSGCMHLTVGDEVRDTGLGDMWYAPANGEHGGEILGDEPVNFIDVYAPPAQWITKWIEENQKPTDPSIYKDINVNNVLNRLDAKYPHTVR